MNLGEFSLKNKYLIFSLTIAIVLFGIYSRITIKTQLSPDTASPMATVITQYPGASAQDVVKDIIEPMEDEFGKLEGISKIKSTAQDNRAIIQLEFEYGVNIDEATIDIQNSINRIKGLLPSSMKEPKILKISSADKPIMTLSLSSDSLNLEMIREIAENKLSYVLQSTEGVASVDIFGGYKSEIQIKLDKNKINAYGLTIEKVASLLSLNNIQSPGGKIIDKNKEIIIRIDERFKSIDDIKRFRINLKDGNFIYLDEIADIKLSIEELKSTYRLNGEEAIALMIIKKSNANTVETINNLKIEIEKLKLKYPHIKFKIAQDDSIFTNQMVDNMISSVLIAIILTILIIILFISKLSESFVVSISMPLVFLSTLGLMKVFGMKLDLVTLSALILSIGIVVDDSIVVVENVIRHYDEFNKDIVRATIDATGEITLATMAGTSTTLIVLIPLLFIEGFVGQMFGPLSTTLIFALLTSVAISLTIVPLFIAIFNKFKFVKLERKIKIVTDKFGRLMDKLLDFYVKLLRKAINYKIKTYIIIIILMIVSVGALFNKGIEMLPKFDSGVTYISIEMVPGTTLEETQMAVAYIEDILSEEKNVINFDTQIGYEEDSSILSDFGVMGTNQALITVNLNTRKERKESIWEFQERIRKKIAVIPNIQRFVVKEQGATASSSSQAPIDVRISGPDQEILYHFASEFECKLKNVEGITNIYKSFNMDNLQLNIEMNKERIQELGLSSVEVSKQIMNAIDGMKATSMDIGELNDVDIRVEYMDQYNQSIEDLMDMHINTPMGVKVPIRDIAAINISKRANVVTKEDLEYTIDILAYTHDRAFSKIVKDINKLIANFPLPEEYEIELTGDQESLSESMRDMIFLLALSIIFVYLLLVPQFKSFIHPITIMAAIPLVFIGVAPALILTGKYISMPVLLGFILLAGTVINNSILLIDKIIVNRNNSIPIEEAVVLAVKSRYRAIMMTALSDVAGMLPLALQLALGSERFSPLAITVIGGIISATFMTMVIIPLIYISFESIKVKIRCKFE